jgi:hypothetical protein
VGRLVRLLVLVGLLSMMAQTASAAIAFDAVSSGATANAGATTLSFSHTVGASGTNRIMIVGVSLETIGTTQVNSITYNGVSLTLIGTITRNSIRSEMWRLLAPATGTHTVLITVSATTRFVAGAQSFTGVDQTTPHGTFQSSSGNGFASTLTVTGSSTGELVVDVLGRDDPSNASVAAGQTQRWNQKTNKASGGGSTKPGASSVTMSWTVTGGANDWVMGAISLRPSLAPSLVKLISFTAETDENGGVLLQWETGYEADNLGFNIYREENGPPRLVTKSLIAGSALITGRVLTSGNSYSWTDRSGNSTARYWLEDVDLDGTTTWHGPIVASDPHEQREPVFQMRDAQPIEMVGAEATRLDLSAPVSRKAKAVKVSPELLLAQSVIAGLPAAKLSVKQEGWHRVTEAELADVGFRITAPQHLQLFADGQEQPFILNGDKGGSFTIEFYGVGLDTTWTENRVYWLVNATSPGLRIRSVQEAGSATSPSSFQYTVERSDRNIYFPALKNGDVDNFFGPVVAAAGIEQALTLNNVDPDTGKDAGVEVRLQGATMAPHEVRVLLNGVELGVVSFNGQDQGLGKFTVSQSMLKEGDNRVSLRALRGSTDVNLGVYTRVTYWHSYKADNGSLRFTANAKEEVSIEGFNSEDVRVVDVTNPNTPLEVVGSVNPQENGSFSLSLVAPGSGKRTLIAFSSESVKRPAAIRPDQPSELRQKGKGADLVVITTRALRDSLEPLKALRQSQNLSVTTVDIEDIYDEFSFGHKTPFAVRDFLSFAKTNWKSAPRFVLLAGDATYDPRNYTGAGDNDLVPTKLVSTVAKESPSDDWFADFDDDGLAELAVGRLPVRTPQDAATVVGKIVSYDGVPATNSALLVNDWNVGYDFQAASRTARSLIPSTIPVVQVDRVVMTDSAAKAAIIENLNTGPKLVNFLGHGSLGIWNGNLFNSTAAKALRNRDQLSVYLMMTCYNGWFLDTTNDGLAEVLLKSPDGGAVAVWASSGMTEAAGQVSINQDLLNSLFNGNTPTIGEAIVRAKAATGDRDVRSTWILFGDPSMKLR